MLGYFIGVVFFFGWIILVVALAIKAIHDFDANERNNIWIVWAVAAFVVLCVGFAFIIQQITEDQSGPLCGYNYGDNGRTEVHCDEPYRG